MLDGLATLLHDPGDGNSRDTTRHLLMVSSLADAIWATASVHRSVSRVGLSSLPPCGCPVPKSTSTSGWRLISPPTEFTEFIEYREFVEFVEFAELGAERLTEIDRDSIETSGVRRVCSVC